MRNETDDGSGRSRVLGLSLGGGGGGKLLARRGNVASFGGRLRGGSSAGSGCNARTVERSILGGSGGCGSGRCEMGVS